MHLPSLYTPPENLSQIEKVPYGKFVLRVISFYFIYPNKDDYLRYTKSIQNIFRFQ